MPWVFIALFFGVGGLSILLNLVLKGIVVPIRLRNRVSIVGKPEYRPTTMEELTPEMQQFVGSLIHKFQALGFEPAANLSNPGTVPGVSCVFILLVNRKTGDMATLTMTSAENIRALVFAITSTFADETEIVTGVNPSVGTDSKDKRQDVAIFSWVREPAVLLEAHARRLLRAGRQDEPRIFPSPGEEIAFIENDWARNIARSVERGERYFDPKTGKYWMTWRNAFLLSWGLQEPIKSWRIRLRDRKSRRLWQQLGMAKFPDATVAAIPRVETGLDATTEIAASKEVDAPVAAPSIDSSLDYQVVLPEGEIRREQHGEIFVVRMGTPTLLAYLRSRSGNLLSIVFWSVVFTFSATRLYRLMQFFWLRPSVWSRPGVFRFLWPTIVSLVLWVALLSFEVVRLLRGLVRVRGTTVLTASHQGLRFANVPHRTREGFLPRETIELLRVRAIEPRLLRKGTYQLEAKQYGSPRLQPLLIGNDAAALAETRSSLMRALGIVSAQVPAAAAPVAIAL